MALTDLIALAIAIVISELAGALGSLVTLRAIPAWYAGLRKPPGTPPNGVFGPVWTTLYLLMGISAFLVWQADWARSDVQFALMIFGMQLILNVLWSFVFFGWRRPFAACAVIIVLWFAIAGTLVAFLNISAVAGCLLIPYLLWVTFATYLNLGIAFLN